MSESDIQKVTYTPAEFAKVFGKERTWAYRQLYAGKVNAISEFGRTLIPQSEVDRLLQAAGRYLGAGKTTEKGKLPPTAQLVHRSIKQEKKPVSKPVEEPKPLPKRKLPFFSSAAARKSAYERLTKRKKPNT